MRICAVLVGLAFLAPLVIPSAADAAPRRKASIHSVKKSRAARGRKVVRMPASPTDPLKDAALIVDGLTGKVLYARNESVARHPASLTKMMTLYLLFEALRKGQVTMQTPLPVSAHAVQQKPTKLYLKKGETISVDNAIRSLVIRSANDVAVVIAEALGGTEGSFASMMTQKARMLGMRETLFYNASGLPNPLQITTATDLAMLARRLAYDFPQYYPYFGLAGFTWKGTWYPTHDNLIGRYQGADGIKTGYTGASGFNLVSSVVRGGNHIIGVVMGGRTAVRRDMEMMRILDNAFTQIAANPTLVARSPVPWQTVASASPAPSVAGFSLSHTAPADKFTALSALPSAPPQNDDEDAAERRVAADEDPTVFGPTAPRTASLPPAVPSAAQSDRNAPAAPSSVKPLAARAPATPVPSIRPTPRPANGVAIASAAALPKPLPRPVLRQQIAEGDIDPPAPTPGHNWTIQIGAYADQNLARTQLSAYAEKSSDVLGQASRIVTPALGADGQTLYRARFGLFAEQEARDVCSRLAQRGQTCFAAVAAR